MTETYRIRPAVPVDLRRIHSLLREGALPPEGVEERLREGYVVAVCGAEATGVGGIEDQGPEVVGVCGVEKHGPYGLLRSLAVSSPQRGTGIGRILVENRIKWAADEGLRALYLLTTDAEGYFERFGFVRIERAEAPAEIKASSEFSSLCPESAAVMVLPLSGRGEGKLNSHGEDK